MKIKPEHFERLKKGIEALLKSCADDVVDRYEHGDFPRSDKVKDLQMRFCFDLLNVLNDRSLIMEIYLYANDDHIYTALKKICPKLERKY